MNIDVMVIGEMPLKNLLNRLREPKNLLGRDINLSLFAISEIKQSLKY